MKDFEYISLDVEFIIIPRAYQTVLFNHRGEFIYKKNCMSTERYITLKVGVRAMKNYNHRIGSNFRSFQLVYSNISTHNIKVL